MELKDDAIFGFWQWFVKHENVIKACIEEEHSPKQDFVVESMNEHILGIGVLTWDLGLDDSNAWFLMLSPNGNDDMLSVSEQVMLHAPEHMNWLFYAGRPAKNWNRHVTVYDDNLDACSIDANSWQYVVFEEEDGTLEIVLEAQNAAHLDLEILENAAEQFVVQEIGEIVRMRHISTVSIVSELESEFASSKDSIAELKAHVDEHIHSISDASF